MTSFMLNWTALDPALLVPPLLAGILVLATHVPLGQRVLARGIIFLDLAVAQLAVLGVIVAHTLGWETQGWQTQLAAAGAALIQHVDLRKRRIGQLFVFHHQGRVGLQQGDVELVVSALAVDQGDELSQPRQAAWDAGAAQPPQPVRLGPRW